MHKRYGQAVIAVAIVGVVAGGTTAAVSWMGSGSTPNSTSVNSSGDAPASVLGFATAAPTSSPTAPSTPTSTPPPSTTAPAPASTTPPAAPSPTAAPVAQTKPPITYVVKQGDNLSVIAWWFQVHGYGAIYQANKAVIGDNPNLIFPGQRLTIANGHLMTGSH